MRRFLGVLGVAALMAASALPAQAADPSQLKSNGQPTISSRLTGAKTPSGKLAQSDPNLLKRTDSAMVNVMVKLDLDGAASYAGGVNGLAATSPSATGMSLSENSQALNAYKSYATQRVTLAQAGAKNVVPNIKMGRQFTIAYGGFSATVPANQAKDLLKVRGVVAVQYDSVNKPTALDSPDFVGATQVWPSLGGNTLAGKGVKFADLDTGIWPENPMLADNGNLPAPKGGPFPCNFGTSGQPGDAAFTCNNKLIGAYAFTATNLAVNGPPPPGYFCKSDGSSCSARDGEGHGTHTATTAAGDYVEHAVLLGVDRGPIAGIAPGAEVLMYRVCIQDSCYESDSVDAVQQAILDDVDVINFSIGGGGDAYTDPVELAFLDAYASGIAVNASAGNSGPGAATAEHDGPWETTVGASTLNRSFESTLHLTADGGASLDVSGVTITAGITSPTPVILASDAPYSTPLCDSPPSSSSEFAGKILVCERGINARVDKGYNAYLGGAAGFVLYNQSAGVTDLESDNHWLPAIQTQYDGNAIADFVSGHTNVMATWAAGSPQSAQGDVMASFSSRGPEPDFIKPDVTAPGVQILAGNTPQPATTDSGPSGQNFQAIAGTSMSSPHASGISLLLKAKFPSWTPGQIKSAMMTTAVTDVVKEDGTTPADPFDRGAGSIRANRAINPTVTFEVKAPDFYASASDPFSRVNLNLASIDAPNMPGSITITRTAHNVTGVTQKLKITGQAPNGATITASQSTLTVSPWGNTTFTVTIDAPKLADGWYFGSLTLNPKRAGYNNAVLPVAFNKQPGQVSLTNGCEPPGSSVVSQSFTMTKGQTANCAVTVTNLENADAHVYLKVNAPNTKRLIVKNYSDGDKKANGFLWNGTLSPALAPPVTIQSPSNLYGYIPLDGFGPLNLSMGDEDIVNLNGFGQFSYGGEQYSQLGVDSNGYAIVGGSESSADNVCCDTMAIPDPAAPNNVLAPYWTDLNPGAHGKVQAALLTDGTYNYLAVEWQDVPIYGTSNYRSFELWIVLGDRSTEDQTFDYAAVGPGASTGLIVGAENRDGTSGGALALNEVPSTDGYTVVTGTPIPGGTKTITYDLYGKKKGNFDVTARMSSDVTQGTAIQIVHVKVTN